MKVFALLFQIIRSLLAFFGLGGGNCMYYPTCGEVITESLENKGLIRSFPLVTKRVYICNPIYRKFGKKWQY